MASQSTSTVKVPLEEEEGVYPRRARCDIRSQLADRQRLVLLYSTNAAAPAILRDDGDGDDTKDAASPSSPVAPLPVAPIKIQAPMVRCSRSSFRQCCRLWGTDVSYTHMFMAESIAQSAEARAAEISFVEGETNIVAQIAAKSDVTAGQAAVVLAPHVDAIDLNCGCPQRWAIAEGVGAALMQSPELVADMVRSVWRTADLPCVVKTRVFEDARRSVDWARQQEAAGAAWITIHGRLPTDPPSHPVRWETVKLIRESVGCPVVLNGGVESLRLAHELSAKCGVGGVMTARALLANPAMFAGHDRVPLECVRDFVRLAVAYDTRPSVVAHHLNEMLDWQLSPQERNYLSQCKSVVGMVSTLQRAGILAPEDA